MEVICPECYSAQQANVPTVRSKLICRRCKAEFLTPIEFLIQPEHQTSTDFSVLKNKLENEFRSEQERLQGKFQTRRRRLNEAIQEVETKRQERLTALEKKTIKRPLVSKLLKINLIGYAIAVCLLTLFLMFYWYGSTRQHLNEELKATGISFGKGLADALWNVDEVALQAIMTGMLEHPVIIGIRIEDEAGDLAGSVGIIVDEKGNYLTYEERMPSESDVKPVTIDPSKEGITGILKHKFNLVIKEDQEESQQLGSAIVYSNKAFILQRVKGGYWLLLFNAIIVGGALGITFLWTTRKFLMTPLSLLTRAVSSLNINTLDMLEVDVKVKERNELKVLEESFNEMVQNLVAEKKRILTMSNTFEKFVPKQFLHRIADKGFSSVKLGGMESDRLTILYSRIRFNENLLQKMNSDGIFQYLNNFLTQMETPIEKQGGFIHQLEKDALMALFDLNDRKVEALCAIYAAIDMQRAVAQFNNQQKTRGHPTITMHIGIHSGNVTFGTLGNETRLDPTIIGEAIEATFHLQAEAESFNSQILLSADTFELIENRDTFLWREASWADNEQEGPPKAVYEVFHAEPVRELKLETTPLFHNGLNAYSKQQWDEAIQCFRKCLEVYPLDMAAQQHLKKSQQHKQDQYGDVAFLHAETNIFNVLSETQVGNIVPQFKEHDFMPGDAILKQGDIGQDLFIINAGEVEVLINTGEENETVVAKLKRGDCFGEMSLLTGQPVRATIKGHSSGRLLILAKEQFDEMLQDYPALYPHFYNMFLERLLPPTPETA